MRHFKGFTLIEGIITLAIVAVSFIFLFQSFTIGLEQSAYRSGLKEISVVVESIADSSLMQGNLDSPYTDWKYSKTTVRLNNEAYTKIGIILPSGETFNFYRWQP